MVGGVRRRGRGTAQRRRDGATSPGRSCCSVCTGARCSSARAVMAGAGCCGSSSRRRRWSGCRRAWGSRRNHRRGLDRWGCRLTCAGSRGGWGPRAVAAVVARGRVESRAGAWDRWGGCVSRLVIDRPGDLEEWVWPGRAMELNKKLLFCIVLPRSAPRSEGARWCRSTQ